MQAVQINCRVVNASGSSLLIDKERMRLIFLGEFFDSFFYVRNRVARWPQDSLVLTHCVQRNVA